MQTIKIWTICYIYCNSGQYQLLTVSDLPITNYTNFNAHSNKHMSWASKYVEMTSQHQFPTHTKSLSSYFLICELRFDHICLTKVQDFQVFKSFLLSKILNMHLKSNLCFTWLKNQVGVKGRTPHSSTSELGARVPAISFTLWLWFTCKERTQCTVDWVFLNMEMRNIPNTTATQTKAVTVSYCSL